MSDLSAKGATVSDHLPDCYMSVPAPHRLREVCICDRLITMEDRIVRRVQGHTYTYRGLYVSIVETTVQEAVAAIKARSEK